MEELDNQEDNNQENDEVQPKDNGRVKDNTLRGKARRGLGTLKENIQKARKGDSKAIVKLKIQIAIYATLAVFFFLAIVVVVVGEDLSDSSNDTINTVMTQSATSGSAADKKGAEYYNKTGSLALATKDQLKEISDTFLNEIEGPYTDVHSILNAPYFGVNEIFDTVASKVKHITTDFTNNTTETVEVVPKNNQRLEGELSLFDQVSLYEHLLRAEKYNFNNITWRSFTRNAQGNGFVQESVQLQLDKDSGLKYPASSAGNLDADSQDLDFFLTKVRPYLQNTQIPYDMIVGITDMQNDSTVNGELAFQILTRAYHDIVVDRYKLSTATRKNRYVVYDETRSKTRTERECNKYKVEQEIVVREEGVFCNNRDLQIKGRCDDTGRLKYDVIEKQIGTATYCTDSEKSYSKNGVITDIRQRKELQENNQSYRWTYVVSLAKMFDKVISNEYEYEPYTSYSTANYYAYINKSGDYATMSVEDFAKSEEKKSNAYYFTHEAEDYYEEKVETKNLDEWAWNADCVVDSIPAGAVIIEGTDETREVKETEKIVKSGKQYTDTYTWSDELTFKSTKTGIYNLDSVKDVTGDDLTSTEEAYYNGIYNEQQLNLIDLMNSDDTIYEWYLTKKGMEGSSSNIGLRKGALDNSYSILSTDLKEYAKQFPISGLMYGSSIASESGAYSILGGLNISQIAVAGGFNEAIVQYASQFEGKQLKYFLALDDHKPFWESEWCAMFVSYVLRKVQEASGVQTNIDSFVGCTKFWTANNTQPGFYDISISGHGGDITKSASNKVDSYDGIQPGDILLFKWAPGNSAERQHTGLVQSVTRDEEGHVIEIKAIEGNTFAKGETKPDPWDCKKSFVRIKSYTPKATTTSTAMSTIVSYVSISTVLAEAQLGNPWK